MTNEEHNHYILELAMKVMNRLDTPGRSREADLIIVANVIKEAYEYGYVRCFELTRKDRKAANLMMAELEHCATLVNDHGRPAKLISRIKKSKK